MVLHEFDNDNDVILWAFSALLDFFKKQDMLFEVQCIWWLPSIIQFTEILTYYWHYKIFPSEYLRDCQVTPLNQNRGESSRSIQPGRGSQLPILGTMCSGKILKNPVPVRSHTSLKRDGNKNPELSKSDMNKESGQSRRPLSKDEQKIVWGILDRRHNQGV